MFGLGNEFWSAIAGAVVGGVIAFLIQLVTLHAAKKERVEVQTMKRKALAESLLFKVIQIHSHLQIHLAAFQASLTDAAANGMGSAQLWQVIPPIANHPCDVTFAAHEMAMLLSLGDDDMFNDLAALDERHNALAPIFELYGSKRTAVTDFLKPDNMNGLLGSATLTKEDQAFLLPKVAELEQLILSLHKTCQTYATEAEGALDRLVPLLQKRAGVTYKVIPKTFPPKV